MAGSKPVGFFFITGRGVELRATFTAPTRDQSRTYSRSKSRMTSISENEVNIRNPLYNLNGMLKKDSKYSKETIVENRVLISK